MNIRRILLCEKYTLMTHLSSDEIYGRLNESIVGLCTSFYWLREREFEPDDDGFEGELYKDGFSFGRIKKRINQLGFLTLGKVVEGHERTEIVVVTRPDSWLLVSIIVFLLFLGSACVLIAGSAVLHFDEMLKGAFPFSSLIPFIALTVFLVIVYYGYNIEREAAKYFLTYILEAEEAAG